MAASQPDREGARSSLTELRRDLPAALAPARPALLLGEVHG
jgi:hypothetical protein